MTHSLEQSFKKRLQLIAKERNVTPAEVWQNVITESARELSILSRPSPFLKSRPVHHRWSFSMSP